MDKELKDAVEGLGRDWETFKGANDALIKAKADGKAVADLDAKVQRIDAAIADAVQAKETAERLLKAQADRIDALEAAAQNFRPMKPGEAIAAKHKELFNGFLRGKSNNGPAAAALAAFERTPEGKAISTAANATGGFAVPEEIARSINDQEILLSPVRSVVKVVQAGTPDYKELVAIHNTSTGGWAGETDSRSETGTAGLRERAPTFGMLYAYPKATEESVDDVFFNVAQFITDHAATTFAQKEGISALTGNGTKQLTGLLNTAPVATDDDASPERAAAALELIPLAPGTSPMGVIVANGIMDLVYGLRAGYRANARFAMNSVTQGTVRKLKDTTNQYLWAPGLANGQPATLMGYPIVTFEDMASIAANAIPILFGDFKRGYLMVDLVGLRITVDQITTPGYIKWYIRRRVGGCVLDNYAIKAGKCVAA